MLECKDRFWIEEVWLAIATPLVFATNWKLLCTWDFSTNWICQEVALNCLFGNHIEIYSAKTRCRSHEELIDYILRKSDCFKYLSAGV